MKVRIIIAIIVSIIVLSFGFGNILNASELGKGTVSSDWLNSNMNLNKLVVIDIRSAAAYESGHIENSINIPFIVEGSTWVIIKDGLLLELPKEDELTEALGNFGIEKDSNVVVVTSPVVGDYPPYVPAGATRVADTLLYAGVKKVSILDGGYTTWVNKGYPTSTEIPEIIPTSFNGEFNNDMFVSMDYVYENLDRLTLVDARDKIIYTGPATEPFAGIPGHINTALSLPAPLLWNLDEETYASTAEIELYATSLLGTDKHQEIVLYCGVGGYASGWWYALTEILDYDNVKIYDGSIQEWAVNHPDKMVQGNN